MKWTGGGSFAGGSWINVPKWRSSYWRLEAVCKRWRACAGDVNDYETENVETIKEES